jgi:hypothetical protein
MPSDGLAGLVPNGVGAFEEIGGYEEEAGAFTAGFDAEPNGVGALVDIGG